MRKDRPGLLRNKRRSGAVLSCPGFSFFLAKAGTGTGIHKKFFPLRLAVITIRHHQIPVHILLHDILRSIKGVLAHTDILEKL